MVCSLSLTLRLQPNNILMEETIEEPRKGRNTLIIILLVLSVFLNIYQWRNNSNTVTNYEQRVDTLVVERVNVEKELVDTKTELEKYRGISTNLDSLLNEANAKIDEQEKKYRSLSSKEKNAVALNSQLKQQLTDLQVLRDDYLNRIDSLLTLSKQLTAEKEELKTNLKSTSAKLESTVSTASMLKAEYLKVTSWKRKGNGKFVEATIAKRTHKLQACFDILDNTIAKPGQREVYLKITEPGGKVIGNRSEGSNSVKLANGEELLYTTSTTVDYANTKQNVCLSYEEQKDKMFPTGTYLFEVYIDGNLAGSSSYALK
jgi:predicted  nucleic acid-binding Zn-ribbon protein